MCWSIEKIINCSLLGSLGLTGKFVGLISKFLGLINSRATLRLKRKKHIAVADYMNFRNKFVRFAADGLRLMLRIGGRLSTPILGDVLSYGFKIYLYN